MTESPVVPSASDAPEAGWYALTPEQVAAKLDVDPTKGLSAAKAAESLAKNGPNALPAEATVPGWKQFLAQYSSYMQIILVAAAVASMIIGEIATGVVVLLITALNALVDAPAGQGRERDERAAVDAQGIRTGSPRRRGGQDRRRPGRRRRAT